ncbi:hypothetical protein SAMN05661080_01062 [Modestobacter sp. DSM 44400]|uniref:hypothetical protein n=1 Tax=Modestobacter sp. DSM 44400 TaxID=1550230 RepID=UPI00089B8DEE|nr:hypothetical protein [Modestobacter sp. DSM 44400]SDX75339.1 hypothetical protein SAMN05661080_01062 [Modestobacter sp. DSM 44400]
MTDGVLPVDRASRGPGSTPPGRRARNRRWVIALVVALVVAAGSAAAVAAVDEPGVPAVTVRTPDGDLIARIPLAGDTFAVSYRNSIYHTLAEERYRVRADGRFELVEIAADQLAVLEEYYAVPGAPRAAPVGDRRNYVVEPNPAQPAVFRTLRIAATDLGERTLHVPGHVPIPIWQRVVTDDPTVILDIEES